MLKKIALLIPFSLTLLAPITQATSLTDIDGHWGKATIEWALQQDMINGFPDGTFQPNKHVTEAEFLSMIIRFLPNTKALLQEEDQHQHIQAHAWYDHFYTIAKKFNMPVDHKPNALISRGKVAEIISGIYGVHYSGDDAIKYLLVNQLANGKISATVKGFEGRAKLTRAEAVQFIKGIADKGITEAKGRPLQEIKNSDLTSKYIDWALQHATTPKQKIEIATSQFGLLPGNTMEYTIQRNEDVYAFLKKTQVVNGKVRVYLPQTYGKGETLSISIFDAVRGEMQQDFNNRVKKIPLYAEYPVNGKFAVTMHIMTRPTGVNSAPFASGTYSTFRNEITINGKVVEEF